MDNVLSMVAEEQTPAALFLTETPPSPSVTGYYDVATETWSNRLYESAATKKHNEAM